MLDYEQLEAAALLDAEDTGTDDEYGESGFLRQTLEEAFEIAAGKGCVVRVPGPRELFIDIDSDEANVSFERLRKACPADLIDRVDRTPSPSGRPGHYHIVVRLNRDLRDDRERVLLQAVLGSDPMRELLSWRRIENGSDSASVSIFFEKAGN
jgi:hypothetical protein